MIRQTMLTAVVLATITGSVIAEEVSLTKDLMPLFERSCAVCHTRDGSNERAVQNGTYYQQKTDILSIVGTYIIPGKPENTGLLRVLNQSQKIGKRKIAMPPPKATVPKWSPEELKKFSDWVTAGAKDN